MSEFITKLEVEQVTETMWSLDCELTYKSDYLNRYITAPRGFTTDFASVPRIPIIYDLVGNRGGKAATIHDFLYDSKCGFNYPRKTCDLILKEALISEGVPKYMAWIMYLGVRLFGMSHFRKG